jgi:flagella basal body P-ring formation protein FlgA
MIRTVTVMLLITTPICADTVLAARTIPAQTTILPEDLIVNSRTISGGVSDPQEIIGMEARVALYAGRPIRAGDIGFPAVVERNQIIALHYNQHGLAISTEGRALGRAGPGDVIRVMNISSRSTVTAQIGADGAAYVSR